MVCKKSFSAAASTHAEEVFGAEAGRQGKVTSEIKERGEGNREVERKKNRNYPSNPSEVRKEENLGGKGSEKEGSCVNAGLHQPPTWCLLVRWLQRVQPCWLIKK